MTFQQWLQIVGPIVGALMANFFELRKIRHEMATDRKLAETRHMATSERLDAHDKRLAALEEDRAA
jgi:hypothetical protein